MCVFVIVRHGRSPELLPREDGTSSDDSTLLACIRSGATLGVYMEGDAAAKEILDAWLEPLRDLGATENVIDAIGSTDMSPSTTPAFPPSR